MKFYFLTSLAILLGIVSLFQTAIQFEYKEASFRPEILESPWILVGTKHIDSSKKSAAVADVIDRSYPFSVPKASVNSYKAFTNAHYLPVYSLIHQKHFFLLI